MPVTASLQMLGIAVAAQWRRDGWVQGLASVEQDLVELNRQTEEAFVVIGNQVTGILADSHQLHAQVTALNALAAGRATEDTGAALAAAGAYLQELRGRSEKMKQAFQVLRVAASRIRGGTAGLTKIAVGFQIAAIVARIETAWLGLASEGVGNLTDEVRNCSSGIQAQAEEVMQSAADLAVRIESSLAQAIQLADRQEREMPALLAMIDADLAAVAAQQAAAALETSRLSEDVRGVSSDLSAIIMSLQAQDITRQQLEHVQDGLNRVRTQASWGVLTPDGADVIRVQKAQLRGAAATFLASIATLDRGLRDLESRVEAMANVPQDSGQHQCGFLVSMERRLTTLVQALEDLQAAEEATRSVAGDLGAMTKGLDRSVAEIQAIELQLQRVAINASLSACHIGPQADALGVVVGALRQLQADCSTCSEQSAQDLAQVRHAIAALTDLSTVTCRGGSGVVEQLRERMGRMRENAAAGEVGAARVRELAEAISRNLREARGRLGVGDRFAETLERAGDRLDAGLGQVQRPWFYPCTRVAADSPLYTMESERAVHAATLAGAQEEATAGKGDGPPANGPAADVEFF